MEHFLNKLRTGFAQAGIDFLSLSTRDALGPAMAAYLKRREGS